MRFGLFSNGNRNNKVAKLTYDEDLQEVIVADRLGIDECWISEHGTFLAFQSPDQLPCADLFICCRSRPKRRSAITSPAGATGPASASASMSPRTPSVARCAPTRG